ncbi:Pyridoxal phosphate-dependent transferase [Pseudocohnilembus persalinus]|uniref:Pyridoxal phosphate-dependent transferase n=1 Tax=Pseudocohnilembus persalinus TaxID=266149 RepID=A0A0V0QEV9_PSEPJ|nr:Pyridoxal phosphate-dependent transferase [Pseudocohnilembus persalinus]|eukprot:KRX00680.1 Pyridoxal phosphate-dependent transferase [Pseudocohnilembus persalinus]
MQRLNRIITEIKNSSNITVKKQQKSLDLRSDTLTKPSLKMLQYGIQCQVGDDSYKEDPTVNKLQDLLKKIFNKEGAIFLPTTTMGLNWTMPQLEWFNIFDELEYVKKQQIIKIIKQNKNSGIICLENPTFDGQIYGEQYLHIFKELKEQDTSKKLHFHLDGARIFDALTYYCKQKNFDIQNPHNLLENNIQEIIKDKFQFFDSISICFSKGLCCPMGHDQNDINQQNEAKKQDQNAKPISQNLSDSFSQKQSQQQKQPEIQFTKEFESMRNNKNLNKKSTQELENKEQNKFNQQNSYWINCFQCFGCQNVDDSEFIETNSMILPSDQISEEEQKEQNNIDQPHLNAYKPLEIQTTKSKIYETNLETKLQNSYKINQPTQISQDKIKQQRQISEFKNYNENNISTHIYQINQTSPFRENSLSQKKLQKQQIPPTPYDENYKISQYHKKKSQLTNVQFIPDDKNKNNQDMQIEDLEQTESENYGDKINQTHQDKQNPLYQKNRDSYQQKIKKEQNYYLQNFIQQDSKDLQQYQNNLNTSLLNSNNDQISPKKKYGQSQLIENYKLNEAEHVQNQIIDNQEIKENIEELINLTQKIKQKLPSYLSSWSDQATNIISQLNEKFK